MTQQPPNPFDPYAARRRVWLKNLLGAVLLLAAVIGAGVVAFLIDPLALAALACVAVGAVGYHLATSEA